MAEVLLGLCVALGVLQVLDEGLGGANVFG